MDIATQVETEEKHELWKHVINTSLSVSNSPKLSVVIITLTVLNPVHTIIFLQKLQKFLHAHWLIFIVKIEQSDT